MQSTKVTPKLAAQLERLHPSEMFELILELDPRFFRIEESTSSSRMEKIACQKAAFNSAVAPIDIAIRQVGGEVTGAAWINQTLRVRVPVTAIKKLAEMEIIASLDTANSLELESR